MALMATNGGNGDPPPEKEMTLHQCGLVDTCFEEGQYESGIAVLEELRLAKYKPTAAHIRQLLYIALHPPAPPFNDKGKEKEQLVASPMKGSPTKQKQQPLKATFFPSLAATEAAQRLLLSFIDTNSPDSIGRALPKCISSAEGNRPPAGFTNGDEDSYIARESLCILDSKHCWAILREGFIQRKTPPITQLRSSRKRGKGYAQVEEVTLEADNVPLPSSVDENAWPVLDCLIRLFEKDQSLTARSGLPPHSPLLLSQIPPPRSGTGPQWEADAPLDIVFHSLRHENGLRRRFGIRLITLRTCSSQRTDVPLTQLINLTSTVYFDLNMFATSVTSRRFSASSDLLCSLLESLPLSPTVLNFKLVLCRKLLTDASLANVAEPPPRPKPQARIIRRARRNNPSEVEDPPTSITPEQVASKLSLPPSSEILQTISSETGTSSGTQLPVKYQLLSAYGALQQSMSADRKDAEWLQALSSGRLEQVIETTFGKDGGMYRDVLRLKLLVS
ncbi:hypothetical protein BV22DRAFT_1116607 [Leucogyrophana mollusca]|uniref:Uncharacterized protein n=1 Tax=Leucogyrophana mollusca TaxID=85980 RepID=A0ACB8BWN3_9AGAM|nr:hypothetical protein BV22DRAFT_1116607 [Leucogyrophana mollusca]